MAKNKGTIDLRKVRADTATKKATPDDQAPVGRETHAPATAAIAPAATSAPPRSLAWTAYEHEQVDFGPAWYAVPGLIMAGLFALALWVQNYFFALFVLIAFAAFALFRSQPPKKISFSIGTDGVAAGKTLYRTAHIKSFWIFNRPEHPELSLETSQTFSPYVRLPLGDTDQQTVREFLSALLPEQQHPQFLMDEIMRVIGF